MGRLPRVAAVLAVLAMAGCTYVVNDPTSTAVLAKCHGDLLNSFCQVAQPPGTVVVGFGGTIASPVGAAMTVRGLLP